ncbi:hypothetical protein ES703_123179 [subsurface metagenome]
MKSLVNYQYTAPWTPRRWYSLLKLPILLALWVLWTASPKLYRPHQVILLVSLGGVVSCGTGGISGTYVNEDNPSEYLELNEDGTFYLKEMGLGLDGEWEAEGNELRLHLMGMVATAQIKGDKILDEDGKVLFTIEYATSFSLLVLFYLLFFGLFCLVNDH